MPMEDMLGGMNTKAPMSSPSEDDDAESVAKDEAGLALADALEAKDGKAICEAVKTIMQLESYDDEE